MTRKEALQEMLVKVKAGECRNDGTMYEVFGGKWLPCFDAYHGSMDAALSVFEVVLPGYNYDIIKRGNRFTAHVYKSLDDFGILGVSDTPSRALLIAILEALVGMEE